MSCDNQCVDDYMKYRRWTDYNEFEIMMRCPCNIPIDVRPMDFEGADFFKIPIEEYATMLADAPADETNEEKAKRLAAEAKAKATEAAGKAKEAAQKGVDKLNEASGGNAIYIIGGVAVVCLGGLAYYCFSKNDEEKEGGQDDRFTSLI